MIIDRCIDPILDPISCRRSTGLSREKLSPKFPTSLVFSLRNRSGRGTNGACTRNSFHRVSSSTVQVSMQDPSVCFWPGRRLFSHQGDGKFLPSRRVPGENETNARHRAANDPRGPLVHNNMAKRISPGYRRTLGWPEEGSIIEVSFGIPLQFHLSDRVLHLFRFLEWCFISVSFPPAGDE